MHLPPPIGTTEFQQVSSVDEEQIKQDFSRFLPQLHRFLNSVPGLSDLHNVRKKKWKRGAPASDGPFGTFASDPSHWYSFNHGGRNEAQLNVGMFPDYFRIGLGFEMTGKKGGEPAHVHTLYAVFADSLRRQHADAEAMSERLSLEVEWQPVNATHLEYAAPEEAVALLVDPPKEPQWIFWGRLLRRDQDAQILGDPEAFGRVLEDVLCSLVPYWVEANHRGHQMLRG
jgi:hypothetical protein